MKIFEIIQEFDKSHKIAEPVTETFAQRLTHKTK